MGQEKPTPQSELVPRIGTFLFLLGIFALIFFLASDFADKTDFDWLFVGLVLLGFGIFLWGRGPATPPAGRFGIIRRMQENARKRKEERAKKAKRR